MGKALKSKNNPKYFEVIKLKTKECIEDDIFPCGVCENCVDNDLKDVN